MKCGLSYPYYLHDGLGSVTGIVDRDEKLQGIYDYSVFGDERRNTVNIENRYRYTSREFVEEGLYYYRARYMRPDLGRFMSLDPLGMVDGTNMYGYVGNNPVSFTDPSGTGIINCIKIAICLAKPQLKLKCDKICADPDFCDKNNYSESKCRLKCVFRECNSTPENFATECGKGYYETLCKRITKTEIL
ncbi:RHS repeat-associated core domain-containing protein [bacterium]|nr:RHS repeat-associated core domain-containing protein [bacterium]